MAKCEEGYLCSVCQQDVAEIGESDLYLRFVAGLIDPEILHTTAERHVRCNPVLAQFIVAEEFPAVCVDGEFDKLRLDPLFRAQREELLTRAWRRLQEIRPGELPIHEYPLPEVVERWSSRTGPL